jgi:hypothetical protein
MPRTPSGGFDLPKVSHSAQGVRPPITWRVRGSLARAQSRGCGRLSGQLVVTPR